MTFNAYCPYCQKTVHASTVVSGEELLMALRADGTVSMIHTVEVDHTWNLNRVEKQNLLGQLEGGFLKP